MVLRFWSIVHVIRWIWYASKRNVPIKHERSKKNMSTPHLSIAAPPCSGTQGTAKMLGRESMRVSHRWRIDFVVGRE